MTPKEHRQRLFNHGRPNVRPMELFTEEGFGKDMGILWKAYIDGSFKEAPEDMSQEEFTQWILDVASYYSHHWMIEDKNPQFADEKVPVGLMFAQTNGWELEPHFEKFAWSTPRNVLKSIVGFLQMMRYDKDVGIINVYTLKDNKRLFKHIAKNYGVLNYLGLIPHGDVRGDRHVFYIRGRKNGRHS